MSIEARRAQFAADNAFWCGALGYLPKHFDVTPAKRGKTLHIVAKVDGDFIHEVTMPARGMHPDMRAAIAESFRVSIGASDDTEGGEQRRSA